MSINIDRSESNNQPDEITSVNKKNISYDRVNEKFVKITLKNNDRNESRNELQCG